MLLGFEDYITSSILLNKPTSNMKTEKVQNKPELDVVEGNMLRCEHIHTLMREQNFCKKGFNNPYPNKCSPFVANIKELYLVYCGCAPPKLLTDFITERKLKRYFCSEHGIQLQDSNCAAYCLYRFNFSKKLRIHFMNSKKHSSYFVEC